MQRCALSPPPLCVFVCVSARVWPCYLPAVLLSKSTIWLLLLLKGKAEKKKKKREERAQEEEERDSRISVALPHLSLSSLPRSLHLAFLLKASFSFPPHSILQIHSVCTTFFSLCIFSHPAFLFKVGINLLRRCFLSISSFHIGKMSDISMLYRTEQRELKGRKWWELTCIIFSAIYLVIDIHCKLLKQSIVELSHTQTRYN